MVVPLRTLRSKSWILSGRLDVSVRRDLRDPSITFLANVDVSVTSVIRCIIYAIASADSFRFAVERGKKNRATASFVTPLRIYEVP